MISELQLEQASHQGSVSTSTKKSRLSRQARPEINLDQESFNHQTIKKQRALTWRWDSNVYRRNGDLPLQFLARTMKLEKNMQRLELVIRQCQQVSDKYSNYIAQTLKELSCLKTLSFFFKYFQIGEKELYQLCKRLSSLVHLQKLRLSFRYSSGITNKTLACLSQSIKKLSSMQELSLSFPDCTRITDAGLGDLSQCLKRLVHLKKLKLDFSYCSHVTDVGLKKLKKGLENLVSLEHLGLDMSYLSKITDSGIQHIRQSLKGKTLIKSIRLECYACGITDASVVTLGEDWKGVSTLENLYLDFSQCFITDRGMNGLTRQMNELGFLQKLSLNLSSNDQITDYGLRCLAYNLKRIARLKKVSIRIEGCPEAGHVGRYRFFEIFGDHARVELHGCTGINRKQQRMDVVIFSLDIGLIGLLLCHVIRYLAERVF